MRRYVVFAGYDYYPDGGWDDYLTSFDDLQPAKDCVDDHCKETYTWAHVVDIVDGSKIYYSYGRR